MIITYDEFYNSLTKHIQAGDDFYLTLLITIIEQPERYCGLFRLSNARNKLIQNITQSREIKFGDFIEELATEYIARLGYINFDKDLGQDENGDELNVDQFFTDGTILYLVEMKVRDDHDSTKKRGQYQNFHKKIDLIRKKYPDKHIDASMWFMDSSLHKNKNYYFQQMKDEKLDNVTLHLYYGSQFFESLKNGKQAWDEFISILIKYRQEHANDDITIPNFGTSEEIYKALLRLPENLWKKLMSDKEIYCLLRKELFSTGNNLEKAKLYRKK